MKGPWTEISRMLDDKCRLVHRAFTSKHVRPTMMFLPCAAWIDRFGQGFAPFNNMDEIVTCFWCAAIEDQGNGNFVLRASRWCP